ncbi:MAG: ABC transporter ATP-binding protein [Propionibacteriaceae bacterium]|nr:ABC transporter ATP-binding protein [Propionibacteriaceae bacterium]
MLREEIALQARSLRRSFGEIVALDSVDLSVPVGALYGLLGPDGAGKTTLLRILATLGNLDAGVAEVNGSNVTDFEREQRAAIGYMPQQFSLYPDLTVAENLRLFAALRGVSKTQRAQRQQLLLDMVGMTKFSERLAGNLSGGMKQKLMLISMLMHDPDLLILDEPTTGVDPLSRHEFWELLAQLHEVGKTILVATPYMEEAANCDEIAFIAAGKITKTGTPDQIVSDIPGFSYEIRAEDLFEVQYHLDSLEQVVTTAMTENALRVLVNAGTRTELAQELSGFKISDITQVPTDLETAFIYLAQQAKAATVDNDRHFQEVTK